MDTRNAKESIRGRLAVLVAAGTTLAVAAATPVLAQDRDERGTSGRSCYCVGTGPGAVWLHVPPVGRAGLGVYLAPEATAEGVRIERVMRRSGAEAAGLRAGDVITAINGRSVLEPLAGEDADDDKVAPVGRVSALLRDVEPGDTVTVEYLRDGERRTAKVVTRDVFGVRAQDVEQAMARAREALRAARPAFRFADGALAFGVGSRFGIQLADVNADLGDYFGTKEGVLVTRVDDDSPFDLRAGDVILSVGGRKVEDSAHLRQILASYRKGETVKLDVLRKRQRVTVEGRAP